MPADGGGEGGAGGGQAEREAAQRLAVAGQPGQLGLIAEADRAVQLVSDPEDDLGRCAAGPPG